MKIQCDKVLTVDDFSEEYASWKGRSLTIMDDQIKVSQDGLKPRYYDTIYLFEDSGILVGFTYNDVVPECYITTMDGLESEPFADVAPYIFEDLGRAYAVVKKQYRNTDLRKHVIGLNLVEIHSLDPVYAKFTWPMWECVESMHNGAILIKKAEANYALSTIDTFPSCYIANNAVMITKEEEEENTYCVKPSALSSELKYMDITKTLSKIKLK